MDLILEFFVHFWNLSLMIGIYLIIGVIFVGVVHLYISEESIRRHLGKESRYSAIKGALYGIPLPLCSCGVIPLAKTLRDKGASKKAVTSFFITTPMTGVDSMIATYGIFGLPMAISRVVSSFISGVLAGVFVKESHEKEVTIKESGSCCSTNCCASNEVMEENLFKKASNYALNEVFSDIAQPMFYGLLLATLFMMMVPNYGIEFLNENLILAYILVFIIALPLYVCSISAIPIAFSMVSVGVTPGVAFLFLAAAPATNIITAGIIKKILGNDVLLIYIASIVLTTLSFALMIDFVFPKEWFLLPEMSFKAEELSWLDRIGGVLFLSLLFYYLLKNLSKK